MIETGASDHGLLIFSFLKTSFTKLLPNKLRYSKKKSFDEIEFSKDVSNLPEKTNYAKWENHFIRVLNRHAKKKLEEITNLL